MRMLDQNTERIISIEFGDTFAQSTRTGRLRCSFCIGFPPALSCFYNSFVSILSTFSHINKILGERKTISHVLNDYVSRYIACLVLKSAGASSGLGSGRR